MLTGVDRENGKCARPSIDATKGKLNKTQFLL